MVKQINQTISDAPTAPNRDDPDTFADRADAFVSFIEGLDDELNTWADEANAVAEETNAASVEAEAGLWDSTTTYNTGDGVIGSDANTYRSKKDDNTGNDPVTDDGTYWKILTSLKLSKLPADAVGQTSSDVTLDLSQYSVFELEPTADITISVIGLGGPQFRATGYLSIKNGGDHVVDFSSDFLFLSQPSLTEKDFIVKNATFDGSFDIGGQEEFPNGLFWNGDGSKFWIIGNGSDSIHEYTPATNGTILDGATFDGSFDVSSQDNNPEGLFWNGDGSKFWVVGGGSDSIHEYTPATNGTILDGATFDGSFDVSSQESNPDGLFWNSDGSRFWIIGNSIFEYTPATNGTILDGATFDGSTSILGASLFWNGDGSKFWTIEGDSVSEYTPTTSDTILDGATFDGSFDVSSQESNPEGLFWNSDGSRFWIIGNGSDSIHEYTPKPKRDRIDVLQLTQYSDTQVVTSILHEGAQ